MIITYRTELDGVDWNEVKAAVAADDFDNGRTPEQLRRSFLASRVACVAYADGALVGTARALSDGVCNAYVIDVWTRSDLRWRRSAATIRVRAAMAESSRGVISATGRLESARLRLSAPNQPRQ